uniref:DNA-directed DNA polymerase n=1 Tax=Marseillevirus LCMAC101 TaxID=2506602 RepID=A0A481YQR4_9VIRU|nr:MAG: DNA polymerase family X [Marseillevirus LCMAC101]
MELYSPNGKIARGKNPKNAYYKRMGKLQRVPTHEDSKEKIFDFLETCIGHIKPNISRKDILDIWNFYLGKHSIILSYLEALLAKHTAEGDARRITAYRNAIKTIKNSKVPIASGAQAIKLKGIGKKTADKIDEILGTGGLETVDTRMKEELSKQKNIELFMSVWGIGVKHARTLYDKGYRTLKDLKNASEKEITPQVKLGLKYHKDLSERIPRKNIDYIKPKLRKILRKVDPDAKFCIAGSYRRGLKTSGDIDIIISSDKPGVLLKEYVKELHQAGVLKEDLAKGRKKYEGIGFLKGKNIRIDILSTPPGEWGTALLYFSSGFDFNKMIRREAREKGWTLSESGMKNLDSGKILKFATEEEVFKRLKMKYVPPEERL